MSVVPVLEVGGTHATAIHVDAARWAVIASPANMPLAADGAAQELLSSLATCATALGPLGGATLAVAMPGPFDYAAGIGRFRDVGKFEALNGVDVGAELRTRLTPPPARLVFVNDAAAFGLGEWLAGAAQGTRRSAAITLGTGVGSAFVADGASVSSGSAVPPEGSVHRLEIDGQPLESVVSRRAILTRYGQPDVDVSDVAERAASGDSQAHAAFSEPLTTLGGALAPWLARFGAEVLVVGGAMSKSWSLVEPALRRGLGTELPIRCAGDTEAATAIGAAWHAVGASG